MNYTLKTPPTIEPVDLALAKVQCRIEPDVVDEDGVPFQRFLHEIGPRYLPPSEPA